MRIIEPAYWTRESAEYIEGYIETPTATFDGSSFWFDYGTLSLRSSHVEITGMYVSLSQDTVRKRTVRGVKKAKKVEISSRLSITKGDESGHLFLVKLKHEEYFPVFLPEEPYINEEVVYDQVLDLYLNSLYIERKIESSIAKKGRTNSPPYSSTIGEITATAPRLVPLL